MKRLDTAQMEQLTQIGEYLSQERQARSISLDEIAVKTYIPLRLLQAIDQCQIERLPEPVFVQGFIRRYADALGLDGSALAKTFMVESAPTTPMSGSEPVIPMIPETSRMRPSSSRSRAYLPYAIAGGVAVLVLGVAVFSFANRSKPSKPTANAAIAPTKPAAAKPTAQKPATPIQVTVDAKEDAWVWVDVDGNLVFEDTLKQGDKKTWTAQKALKLGSVNAGAVRFSYNQSAPKPLGNVGTQAELTFPQPVQ